MGVDLRLWCLNTKQLENCRIIEFELRVIFRKAKEGTVVNRSARFAESQEKEKGRVTHTPLSIMPPALLVREAD